MPQHEVHHRRHKRDAKAEPLTTIVSVVYVTASKTFAGSIAGYTTIKPGDGNPVLELGTTTYAVVATVDGQVVSWLTTDTITETDTSASASVTVKPVSSSDKTSVAVASTTSVDKSSAVTDPGTTLAKSQTSLVVAASTLDTSSSATETSSTSASSASSTASAATSGSSSHGGVVAGVIIGVLGAAAILGLFWLCMRKRSKRAAGQQEQEQEKNEYPRNDIYAGNAAAANGANAAAPRLNPLRPITEFSPNLGGNAESIAMVETPRSPWERNMSERMETSREMSSENPFGLHAAAASNEQNPVNPFGNHAATPEGSIDGDDVAAAAIGVAVAGAASAPARRAVPEASSTAHRGAAVADAANTASASSSAHRALPEPLNLTRTPADPSGNATSAAQNSPSLTTGVAAGASAMRVSVPVHRVIMDFQPTMDDEIALQLGVLIRMHNIYDDGWCYVSRLDTHQLGICPRSCLTTRPIKPRSPQSQRSGPSTPTQGRPMTPQGPMTPLQGREANRPHSPAMSQITAVNAQNESMTSSEGTQGSPTPRGRVAPGQARPMTPGSGGLPSPTMVINQAAMMSQAARPMTPTGPASKPLPASPASSIGSENRGRRLSVSQSQGVSKNYPGPSPLNAGSSTADGQLTFGYDESSSSYPALPASPANTLPRSQMPLPTTPVGRKPVPGQAL